jgi:hypothetical protein
MLLQHQWRDDDDLQSLGSEESCNELRTPSLPIDVDQLLQASDHRISCEKIGENTRRRPLIPQQSADSS